MNTATLKLKKTQRQFNIGLAASMIVIFIIDNVLGYLSNLYQFKHYSNVPKGIEIWMLSITIAIALIVSISEIEFTRLYQLICLLSYCFVFLLTILLSKVTFTIPLYVLPVLCLFLIATTLKNVLKMGVLTLFLLSLLPFISKYFSAYIEEIPNWHKTNKIIIQEYFDIFTSIYLTVFILYFYFKLKKIKTTNNPVVETIENEIKEEVPALKNEALENLYTVLIKHIEDNKIYRDPECSLSILATKINTNKTYLSLAINQIGTTTFNSLINNYRIKQVLEDIKNNSQNKKTLKMIYLDAGFIQQSTFNRIFKEHTNLTPTEYMKQLAGAKLN